MFNYYIKKKRDEEELKQNKLSLQQKQSSEKRKSNITFKLRGAKQANPKLR